MNIEYLKLRLYLVERTDKIGYDEYDSMVCVADSDESAKRIHPDVNWQIEGEWCSDWAKPETLKVTEIGFPSENLNYGDVVISSYNAG